MKRYDLKLSVLYVGIIQTNQSAGQSRGDREANNGEEQQCDGKPDQG
jgi:hypothetical protein